MIEEGYNKREVGRKYARNDLAGRKALDRSEPKVLGEHPKLWEQDFTSFLIFTPESEALIQKRVIDRIKTIGDKLGIEFFLAGKDYPMHSIAQSSVYETEDAAKRMEVYEQARSPEMQERMEKWSGMPITYKYLMVNDNAITLNSTEIPAEIKDFRESVKPALEGHGIKVLPMENILHITIARITKLPDQDREERLQEFKKELIKLRHELSSDPMQLTVDHGWLGTGITYSKREDI